MPFPIVWGMPIEISTAVVEQLRRDIVRTLAEKIDISPSWVHPFFPVDLLEEPTQESEGGNTVYISLETGLFFNLPFNSSLIEQQAKAQDITMSLAKVVWDALNGAYEVECFVSNLDPAWRSIIYAKQGEVNDRS